VLWNTDLEFKFGANFKRSLRGLTVKPWALGLSTGAIVLLLKVKSVAYPNLIAPRLGRCSKVALEEAGGI
jgi:hypothetical protein